MSFSHTIGMTWGRGADSLAGQKSYTGELEVNLELPVPDSSSDLESVLAIDVSEIQSLFIMSDQNMTLETNSAGAPDDTLALIANVPYVWTTDSLDSCLLTVDVTSIFLTQSSGSAATLQIRAAVDSTP